MKTFKYTGTEYLVTENNVTSSYNPEIGDIVVALVHDVTRSTTQPLGPIAEELYSYGIKWDASTTSSTCTRIGNSLLHKELPILNAFKGCVALGRKIMYYLDANDWSKKADGTASRLDGYDGVVKVHTPKFYGKSGLSGNERWVRISTIKIDNTWEEIPSMLIDAYQPTVVNTVPSNFGYMSTVPVNSLVSIANTATWCRGGGNRSANDTYLSTDPNRSDLGKPRTALTKPIFNLYAQLIGNELMNYDIYKWIFCWCFAIEYATLHTQTAYNAQPTAEGYKQGGLGAGITNMGNWNEYNGYYGICPNGKGNALGNQTGVFDLVIPAFTWSNGSRAAQTLKGVKWRGFENPFGHLWKFVDGIIFKRDTANANQRAYIFKSGHYNKTSNPTNSEITTDKCRIVEGMKEKDGTIQDVLLGDKGDILPAPHASASRFLDYYWCNAGSTGYRLLIVGGASSHGGYAGFFAFASYDGLGMSAAHVGALSLIKL